MREGAQALALVPEGARVGIVICVGDSRNGDDTGNKGDKQRFHHGGIPVVRSGSRFRLKRLRNRQASW
jgi:hypothetical protein